MRGGLRQTRERGGREERRGSFNIYPPHADLNIRIDPMASIYSSTIRILSLKVSKMQLKMSLYLLSLEGLLFTTSCNLYSLLMISLLTYTVHMKSICGICNGHTCTTLD